ncbi:MAG TPA: indole-3-glycerol phosphate synthase TrpC [Puia sp.]|nr:indole-3-glycerol phosphate synthase TrpC [Puia sp.]
MNILEKIIGHKKSEVAEAKMVTPAAELERRPFFSRPVLSLRASLGDPGKSGIIAEFKRKSPSKGVINDKVTVLEVTKGYAEAGAACLSVLTDRQFFGGSSEDLQAARVNVLPILRKDFIIDEYQILEARAIGADVILLIAACLKPVEVRRLASFAASLGLEVLLEIHSEEELDHICDATPVVGVNNRDLKTFTVDVERSIRLSQQIPKDKLLIAESGINRVETIWHMRDSGFHGFLVGEHFMKEQDPAIAFASFVNQLKGRR